MPLVEIIHPQDAFDADGKKKLLESLSATCLRWEGIDVSGSDGKYRPRKSYGRSCARDGWLANRSASTLRVKKSTLRHRPGPPR